MTTNLDRSACAQGGGGGGGGGDVVGGVGGARGIMGPL